MKKYIIPIIIVVAGLLIPGACKKVAMPVFEPPVISTGPAGMQFLNPAMVNGDKAVVDLTVTPGSKYSVQITDMSGEVLSSKGLSAVNPSETVSVDITTLTPGVYDVVVMNVSGQEIKQPLIIK